MNQSFELCLSLATVIFSIGFIGIFVRRNIITLLMCIELMLNAVNLVFVAGGRLHAQSNGDVMVLMVITVAACEAAIGLAMVIAIFRRWGRVDTAFLRILRG